MESVLQRLKPELDSLWAWHSGVASEPQRSVAAFYALIAGTDELASIRLRMEFDYVRLYANAISIRAAQHRVLRRLKVGSIS
jgi:hypothetical protein